MSRYRVLRMITWLPRGGIERKIAAVLPRLNRDNFEVHLCCIRERGPLADDLEQSGIPVHVIPFKSRLDPFAIRRLLQLTRQLKIDLIHAHMYRSSTPATILKMFDKHLVVIGQYHNMDTWESRRQLMIDRRLALKRDLNLAVSEAVRENVRQRLSLPPHLTQTLYNCIDLDEFHPVSAAERHAVRERLGIAASAKVVIMVARLVPQKNQAFVIRSIPEILPEVPRAHFVFLGGGPDEEELRQLADELQVTPHVSFLGSRTDVAPIIASSDVAVLPSFKEGFSNAVLESMACGVPLVASDVGGNREVIDHGISGFICETTTHSRGSEGKQLEVNATQFVRYLKRLLAEDDFRARVSATAHQQAQEFSLDAMIHDTEQLYLDLLEARE